MKKYLLLLLNLLSIQLSAQNDVNNLPILQIIIKNPIEEKIIILKNGLYSDSIIVYKNQNKYTLKGKLHNNDDELYDLWIGNIFTNICLNNNDTTIIYCNLDISKKYNSINIFKGKVKGSKVSVSFSESVIFAYENYFKFRNKLKDSLLTIYDSDVLKNIQTKIDSINYTYENYVIRNIFLTPSKTLMSWYIMDLEESIRFKKYKWVVDSIHSKYPDSELIKRRVKSFYKKLEYQNKTKSIINSNILYFSLKDTKNKLYNIEELNKNNYLLIDFWASWCAPCRKAIPDIKKLYHNYKDKNIRFITVSIDKDKSAWLKAIEQEKMDDFINLWDENGEVKKLYDISAIPFTILVSPEGKIIESNLESWQWSIFLNSIFNKKE